MVFRKYIANVGLFIFFLMSNVFVAEALSSKKASLVVDLDSGRILHSNNAHEYRYPASLTKMMTIYLAFKKVKEGELSFEQKIKISRKAAAMPRSNAELRAGDYITVKKAILALIVHSANDAAVVLAEAIAGSEENFAVMMNKQAKLLGMANTNFRNASGWHNKNQKTTAHDLARLAISLKRDFPRYFSWFSETSVTINNKTFISHNHVLRNYEWATGLKTGFTNPSGFNIVTTANKNGKELIGIVLGESSAKARDKYVVSLLNDCFHKVHKANKIHTAHLAKSNANIKINKKKSLKNS